MTSPSMFEWNMSTSIPSSPAYERMRSSYCGRVIGPKTSVCTLPRMFMPQPWITSTFMSVPESVLDAQQPGRRRPQYGDALVVAQAGRRHHVIHRLVLPRIREVGPQHDLARADVRNEVPQRFRREYQRIVVELLQVRRRLFLELRRDPLRERLQHRVGAIHVRREIAAAVRRADLQAREH